MRRRNILWCFLWLPISRRSWGGNSGWASGKGRRDRDVSPGKNFSKIQGNLFRESARWEEPVAITYTGGTTGPAKGVMLSRRAFRASQEQYTQVGTMYGRGGATLVLLPLFSAFGLCQCVHVPLCLGMTITCTPCFAPSSWERCCGAIVRNRSAEPPPTGSCFSRTRGRTKPTCLSCRSHAAAAMP